MYILEKLNDYDLKIEIINLLKSIFLGAKAFKDGILPRIYEKIKMTNMPNDKKIEYFFDNNIITKIFEKRVTVENSVIGSRINEERILKTFFSFLCELLKESSLRNLDRNKLRHFLLIVNKVSSNENLRFVYQ